MIEPIAILISFVVLALCAIRHPTRVRCPSTWHVSTLRPSGAFTCAPTPAASVCNTRAGCDDNTSDPEIHGAIYCTGRSVPVTNYDGRTVGCEQPH